MITIHQPNSTNLVQRFGGALDPIEVPVYRLIGRFEYIHDTVAIIRHLRGIGQLIIDPSKFTIDVSFMTEWEIIEEVIEALRITPDLHVFVESLKFAEDFDGERNGLFA